MNKLREAEIRIDEAKKQITQGIEMAQRKYPKLTMEEVTNAALQIVLAINQVEIETYCKQ